MGLGGCRRQLGGLGNALAAFNGVRCSRGLRRSDERYCAMRFAFRFARTFAGPGLRFGFAVDSK